MPSYNGHKNYNHWNVSLWLNNDENLYSIARHMKRHYANARMRDNERRSVFVARQVLQRLKDEGLTHTPDGVRYTVTTISAALRDM
jgi:dTDP-4-amino-4,6-dideoxygalactose transaminase